MKIFILKIFKGFDNKKEMLVVLFSLLLYVVFSLIWGILEDGTWDDDCPTRYYNTLNAFNEPHNFISVWNRPLFVLIFALPIHLGEYSILIFMILFMIISAFCLYKGVKTLKIPHAYLIIPFLLFQTYFFNISRNNETEQLSVMLICLGFYFFTQKKWMYFAIVGSLIPLARLELSVLLFFWVIILFKEKRFKYVLILCIPTLVWNIAGGIIEGDFSYVINRTIGKENSSNRYGHTTFWHYFKRYIYVIGPIIYFFFSIGILNKIRKLRLDVFIMMQFTAGFFLYVIFSWKLNMGNAAGFLRNLIPLTPLVALIALDGYNDWLNIFTYKKQKKESIPAVGKDKNEKAFKLLTEKEFYSLSRKKRNYYLKEKKNYEEKQKLKKSISSRSTSSYQRKKHINIGANILICIAILLLTYFYSSTELLSHHKIGKAAYYGNIIGLGLLLIWSLLPLISIKFSTKVKSFIHLIFGIGIGLGALSFTLITEPINNNMSPERSVMQKVSDVYNNGYIKDHQTYVNHIWFFWANKLNKFDEKFQLVTIENLDSAEVGSFCIWENHYSHRLSGNVQANYFTKHPEWIEIDHFLSTKNNFRCFIYQKSNNKPDSIMLLHDKYLEYLPTSAAGYTARGNSWINKKKMKRKALNDYTKAIELDTNELSAYFNKGLAYFNIQEFDSAKTQFNICFSKNNKWHQSMHNIAACEFNLGNKEFNYWYKKGEKDTAQAALQKRMDLSIQAYDSTIAIKKDYYDAYLGRSKAYLKQNKIDLALKDLSTVIQSKPKHFGALINRAQIHLNKQDWEPALKDINRALNVKSNQAHLWFSKGMCELNLKNKTESCKSLNKAVELGDNRAKQFIPVACSQ